MVAGVVGTHAATIALGMGANVIVADRNPDALRKIDLRFGSSVRTIFSTGAAVAELVKRADLLIGAVLVPGAKAPKIITREMLGVMKPERHRGRGNRPGRLLREFEADETFRSLHMSLMESCIIA